MRCGRPADWVVYNDVRLQSVRTSGYVGGRTVQVRLATHYILYILYIYTVYYILYLLFSAGEARSLVLIQFTSPNVIHEIRYTGKNDEILHLGPDT
jgi:hypothetical protein